MSFVVSGSLDVPRSAEVSSLAPLLAERDSAARSAEFSTPAPLFSAEGFGAEGWFSTPAPKFSVAEAGSAAGWFSAPATRFLRNLGKLVLSTMPSVTSRSEGRMKSTMRMEAKVPMPSNMPS